MEFITPVLRGHLRIFRAVGLCTIPSNGSLTVERFLIVWSLVLLFFHNILAYIALFHPNSFLMASDKYDYFNDALKFVFSDIAITSSLISAICNRRYVYEFWQCYANLQKRRCNKNIREDFNWHQDIWQNRKFLLIFYSLVACELVVLFLFLSLFTFSRNVILYWCFFLPFAYSIHLQNIQFIFYIELIRLELLKLKEDLHLMVDYSRFHAYGTGFKGFEEFLRSKILEKQQMYQCIYDMYDNFQKSFGFSIVSVLTMLYVRVLVDLYFSYYIIYRNWTGIEMSFIFPALVQMPLFLISSKNCMDVVQDITLNLHSIISQFNNQNTIVTTQLQNFSLQILHQQICINGIGITRMDGYMLVKAIGSLTTYMIFFIQFMPKYSYM